MQRRVASAASPQTTNHESDTSHTRSVSDQADSSDAGPSNTSTLHPLFPSPHLSASRSPSPNISRRRRPAQDAQEEQRSSSSRLEDDESQNKGHTLPFQGTALQRIEGWFGIQPEATLGSLHGIGVSGKANRHANATSATATVASSSTPISTLPAPKSRSAASSATSRLVIQHLVQPADTLEGLALRYGTDARTLRQANGLWPGDSVQARRLVYIPLDKCTRGVEGLESKDAAISNGSIGPMTSFGLVSAPEEVEVSEAGGSDSLQASPAAFRIPLPATEEADVDHPNRPTQRRLMPRASESMLRQRTDSTISATSSATSSSIVPGAPPKVKRVPVQALSHFPPPAPSGSKGTARGPLEGSDEAGADFTFEEPEDIAPGESGVDDLLRLAEKARMLGHNGREDSFNSTAGSQAQPVDENPSVYLTSRSHGALHAESGSSVTSSLRMSGANEWKPNKWTFGASRAGANEVEGRASKPPSQTSGLSAPSSENTSSAALRTSNAGYNGWNDAPEPSLKAHTSGKVAHAYAGKGGKNKRVYAPLIPGNSVLDDLAAGLPPNPGPASNWARPISDSVPMPGSGSAGGTNQGSSSAARKGRLPPRGVQGGQPARATQGGSSTSSAGWGQLFSDTLRGRIKLEEALERGYQEVAASFEGGHTNATPTSQAGATGSIRGRHPHAQPHLAASPPERPSAELARQTLGRSAPVPDLPASNGASTAGGSGADGADPHELERLHSWGRGPPGTVDPAAFGSAEMLATPSSTREDPISSASTRGLSASSRGAARRRGVKEIDWTST